MWTLHKQQQHCGAQLPARDRRPRQPGEAPDEATRDRAAQEHDRAGGTAQPGDYPASPLENRRGDATPGDARVAWDDVVQPEQEQRLTELEQDERDDASKRERAIALDDEAFEDERDAGEGPDA